MIFTIQNILKNALHSSYGKVFMKGQVAHHGIQRSGTNFLSVLLRNNKVHVLNSVDPKRNSPNHKHFRWQDDKSTILMDARYANSVVVDSIDQVDKLCGYPEQIVHFVIFKPPHTWLPSIERWAVRCGWIPRSAAIFSEADDRPLADHHIAYLREWDSYYLKWHSFQKAAPHRVVLLNYEELIGDQEAVLFSLLDHVGLKPKRLNLNVGQVSHSLEFTSPRVNNLTQTQHDVISANITFPWETFSVLLPNDVRSQQPRSTDL